MLKQRVVTGIIIAPIALACVFLLNPFHFSIFVGAILTVAAWEWGNLAKLSMPMRYVYALIIAAAIVGVSFLPPMPILYVGMLWWLIATVLVIRYPVLETTWGNQVTILLIGFIALVPGWVALNELKLLTDASYFICLLFFLIWGADIGAYFSGKQFGKAKLAPRVSPGKSWAGFYGGMLTAIVIAIAMSAWYGSPALLSVNALILVLAAALIAVISVVGDLTMSMFKRHRDIKDSSNLLPGHGGFLDRIDSLLSAAPAFVLYLNLSAIYGS